MTYRVLIDDNYHHGDESERYLHGEFSTLEEAVTAARQIVDDYLDSAYKAGMSADELMASYVMFGEDPFIVAADAKGVLFSARKYARQRCRDICGEQGS